MFEVTDTDCQQFGEGGNREWSYYGDNGNINMGTFYLPCELVNYVFNQLGVGTAQATSILVGQEESGRPRMKTITVPTLNLSTDERQKLWVQFTKAFKPISQ